MALLGSISAMVIPLFLNINFGDSVDSTLINGLLTATAILFGFISLEAKDIKPFWVRAFYISILIVFLMVTGLFYFSAIFFDGHTTKLVALVAFGNFYFCTLCSVGTILARHYMSNEKESES
jgi:hypothetical protein